tara:strand:- start:205 stop:444 length:240 start_codon:yes stop_codon:yes gene_type:complete
MTYPWGKNVKNRRLPVLRFEVDESHTTQVLGGHKLFCFENESPWGYLLFASVDLPHRRDIFSIEPVFEVPFELLWAETH